MARVARSALPDGIYHVVSRGVPEMPIYLDDTDRALFVRLLERTETRHGWLCHAYCLMSTHYHLVASATRRALSRGLCELNGTYARAFNRSHGRFGHLFSDRFSARLIESEEYLFDACAYVLLNPVKAGICHRVEDWPWSYSRFDTEPT
jgi:REP element-mobilizing transposase RayT